jgi:hypothetical protein
VAQLIAALRKCDPDHEVLALTAVFHQIEDVREEIARKDGPSVVVIKLEY